MKPTHLVNQHTLYAHLVTSLFEFKDAMFLAFLDQTRLNLVSSPPGPREVKLIRELTYNLKEAAYKVHANLQALLEQDDRKQTALTSAYNEDYVDDYQAACRKLGKFSARSEFLEERVILNLSPEQLKTETTMLLGYLEFFQKSCEQLRLSYFENLHLTPVKEKKTSETGETTKDPDPSIFPVEGAQNKKKRKRIYKTRSKQTTRL